MIPRGIRNNNPGNLRKSDAPWLGKVAGADPAFEIFDTAAHGIRALARTLLTYQRMHHCRTVGDFILRYAPAHENDTAAYVRDVAKALRVTVDEPLDLADAAVLARLVKAIIRHENGRRPDGSDWCGDDAIENGVRQAMET